VNRRSFLGALLLVPAALGLAAGKAQAGEPEVWAPEFSEHDIGVPRTHAEMAASFRADSERRAAEDAGRAFPAGAPLTFEAMVADCDALGCRLVKIFEVDRSAFVFHHVADPWRLYREQTAETHAEDGQRYVDRKQEALGRVDAWRRALHEGA
jgi:hypothetical protein